MDKPTLIKSFTDLRTWKEGHELGLMIYKLVKNFPNQEQYILSSQMQRAAISITSNIAEGFSRNSNRDKIHFYYIALGSLTEIQNQLLLAKDLDYMSSAEFQKISIQTTVVSKMLNGLIKGARTKLNSLA